MSAASATASGPLSDGGSTRMRVTGAWRRPEPRRPWPQRATRPLSASASTSADRPHAGLDVDAALGQQLGQLRPALLGHVDRDAGRGARSSRRSPAARASRSPLRDPQPGGERELGARRRARMARTASAIGPGSSVSSPSASRGWQWMERAPAATQLAAASASSAGVRGTPAVAVAVQAGLEEHAPGIAATASSAAQRQERPARADERDQRERGRERAHQPAGGGQRVDAAGHVAGVGEAGHAQPDRPRRDGAEHEHRRRDEDEQREQRAACSPCRPSTGIADQRDERHERRAGQRGAREVAHVRVAVGEPAAEPVAAGERHQHDADRVRPHHGRGAERGRDEPLGGDLRAERGDAGGEDDELDGGRSAGHFDSPAAYLTIDVSISHSTGARSSVNTLAAGQRRAELLALRRGQRAQRRRHRRGRHQRAVERHARGHQQRVGRLDRVARHVPGRPTRSVAVSALLQRVAVARVADVDDHRPVRVQVVAHELEELLRGQVERDVRLAVGVDEDRVVALLRLRAGTAARPGRSCAAAGAASARTSGGRCRTACRRCPRRRSACAG